MPKLEIKTGGIKKTLKDLRKNSPKQAIAEYIWNSFDAGANTVKVNYDTDDTESLFNFNIEDDGSGINLHNIDKHFTPFYDSTKADDSTKRKNHSELHGMNGVGRLTFINFCDSAKWETIFLDNSKYQSGSVTIKRNDLENYSEPILSDAKTSTTGTIVKFRDFDSKFSNITVKSEIIPFLVREFAWFLVLNNDKDITINGNSLGVDRNILDSELNNKLIHEDSDVEFEMNYYQWRDKLNSEQSKIYFLNSSGEEVYKQFTSFNRKGDQYFHSVYVKSTLFNSFEFSSSKDSKQADMLVKNKTSDEFKFLIKKINNFLLDKRKGFLHEAADHLIDSYEKIGILPEYTNSWEIIRKNQLCDTIKGFYEVQPQLFSNLNIPQKKTFVRFLDLLLDSNEKDRIFTILDDIVELTPDERDSLSQILKNTRLSNIVDTIKLIEDRYRVYYRLKELVFNKNLNANEVDHLQKMIEGHYWIFGEQYHLVTAAEPKFEEALRRYNYLLTEKDEAVKIDHPHKLKEMDIFACRQMVGHDRIDNIVVELKHPSIGLGQEQYMQVDKYMQVILSQDDFNDSNMYWEFFLIGNKFNTSGFFERMIDTAKSNGLKSLVQMFENGRVKFFAKTWSEIFSEFEIKHKYLNDKLNFERSNLTSELPTASEIVEASDTSTAISPAEVTVPC